MFVLSEYIYSLSEYISSYIIFIERFRLEQKKKWSNRKKNMPYHKTFTSVFGYYLT